ncbi:hypothetical protein ACFQH9_03860 [Pseudonocardia lutea]|jgi:hypothetical protein|uniref:Uncharacterized protein n=1 Tax=Pseudonocardia lutea TaxID=2172015 RepID=A0ABW1I390_9PSEU
MFEKIRALFGRPSTSEDDVSPDTHTARSRETGGRPTERGDAASTTGTGTSEEFVGRSAGQDEGMAGESGAEARQDG